MTFLLARIDAVLTAAITRIGNKLCNALDASLYYDWDLEDTPNDGADPLAEREAEEELAGTPPPTPANQRQPTGRRHDHHEHHQQCVLQPGSTDECETGVGPHRCWRARL
jgi:hypothetical protein